ncbi:hypothetical protein MIND_00903200 [Mycena indigotica]|uniref:Uncharacterized protein n=1 Tax=Mycena indigotica TaxID=2126181 RepID=A0A8H6SIE5_9AGAR|nr:uncharacterized protein MIND_00903200 [Mycena indigotica]KAF7299528.1 hypothetical protein MIND_00903200 [Mycena indigotica]
MTTPPELLNRNDGLLPLRGTLNFSAELEDFMASVEHKLGADRTYAKLPQSQSIAERIDVQVIHENGNHVCWYHRLRLKDWNYTVIGVLALIHTALDINKIADLDGEYAIAHLKTLNSTYFYALKATNEEYPQKAWTLTVGPELSES